MTMPTQAEAPPRRAMPIAGAFTGLAVVALTLTFVTLLMVVDLLAPQRRPVRP